MWGLLNSFFTIRLSVLQCNLSFFFFDTNFTPLTGKKSQGNLWKFFVTSVQSCQFSILKVQMEALAKVNITAKFQGITQNTLQSTPSQLLSWSSLQPPANWSDLQLQSVHKSVWTAFNWELCAGKRRFRGILLAWKNRAQMGSLVLISSPYAFP